MFTALVLVSLAHAENVYRIADGGWDGAVTWWSATGWSETENLWVDISAYNVGYGKRVGIRWTDDGWTTWHDADAWYEGYLGNDWEQWGVDIQPIGRFSGDGNVTKYTDYDGDSVYTDTVTIQYAIWESYGGQTWWNGNGGANYSVTLTP